MGVVVITIEQYWMGRDKQFPDLLSETVKQNAFAWVMHITTLLKLAEVDGIIRNELSSGWRPHIINDVTSNAAKKSSHIVGLGGDIKDPDRAFAQWCVNNTDKLAACGIWMEDPRWTPTWVHLQITPPKSGKRIYIPSNAPPKAEALEKQNPIPVRLVV